LRQEKRFFAALRMTGGGVKNDRDGREDSSLRSE